MRATSNCAAISDERFGLEAESRHEAALYRCLS